MSAGGLFNEVLIKPAKEGCNNLYIVSGYGTAAMAFHHLGTLKEAGLKVNIELILGMCPKDGLSESNHRGFLHLMENEFKDAFKCSYVVNPPPVHSKVYAWFKDDKPMFGFIGSANYTQTGFSSRQKEAMAKCSAEDCFRYYESLYEQTIYCNHIDAGDIVRIYNDLTYERLLRQKIIKEDEVPEDFVLHGLPHVKVSLLDNEGNLPNRSGLNWGQRPELHREPNQGYIRLPADVYKSSFFPDVGEHFTVHTDDDKVLICSRAQQNGKAIHTPHNNSLIGMYFRNRLSLQSGKLVTEEHLLKYGRTDIDFYRIDDETYFMDFTVK